MAHFKATLVDKITVDDDCWNYKVDNLPHDRHTHAKGLVRLISVISNAKRQEINLSFIQAPRNRATSSEAFNKLALISFADFRLRHADKTNPQETYPAPAKDSTNYIVKLLNQGVSINGDTYNFFGHSNSQLKSRSCFLLAEPKEAIRKKIESVGDFKKIKTVGKKAKRIGLLFSSTKFGLVLEPGRCEDIPDIQNKDFNFTDGCGMIASSLLKKLVKATPIVFRNQSYLPAVVQIRYRGYKGVLSVDPSMSGQVQVRFRESMKKFSATGDLTFSVVDHSKPYTFGYLNDEIVLLLHALGITESVLLSKQFAHLNFLSAAEAGNPQAAFRFLSSCNETELAERILLDGIQAVQDKVRRLVKSEYNKLLNKKDEQRCRILIPKSRLLFGICDPKALLKDGECFVRITTEGDGKPTTISGCDVIVTRNPCLHPGDIQKFRAVQHPELAHLVDCIVFPTQGKRASADKMSGGDLDGDQFFVSWDPDIIPTTVSQPAEYPGAKEPVSFGAITEDDRLKYFAGYNSVSLGRVKNLFMQWARLKGPLSPQCQELNRLFSQCVDGNRIRVPTHLEDCPSKEAVAQPFVLDALHAAAKAFIEQRISVARDLQETSFDALQMLLSRDEIAMSEFELVNMTWTWCQNQGETFSDFLRFFDFGLLTDEQKAWTIAQLPPTDGMPSLISNALLQSNILGPADLTSFGLQHPCLHWKCIFDSSGDRMANFLDVTAQTMELFHKKLIIFQVDARMAVGIFLPNKISSRTESVVDDSVRVFTFPRGQSNESPLFRVKSTVKGYRLYFDGHVLQLYNNQRRDTWIYLTCGPKDDSTWRNENDQSARRKKQQKSLDDGDNFDCRASIAMGKINNAVQKHVGRVNRNGCLSAEIYVISNRDVESLRILDLWLDHIDTQETIPVFDSKPQEYTVSGLRDVDWKLLPKYYLSIHRGDSTALDSLSPENVQEVMEWFLSYEAATTIYRIVDHLLFATTSTISTRQLASMLLKLLPSMPYVASKFFSADAWLQHKEDLIEECDLIAPLLLQALLLSCAKYGHGVIGSIHATLVHMRQLSLEGFAEIVELVALTVKSLDLAVTLLLECLQPATTRILIGRPRVLEDFTKMLFALALEHIEEASQAGSSSELLVQMLNRGSKDGFDVVDIPLRLDAPNNLFIRTGDHVRLVTASQPTNSPMEPAVEIDAIVQRSEQGFITAKCLHRLPSYFNKCSWRIQNCGSFVSTKSMLDALSLFHGEKSACCILYECIIGSNVPEFVLEDQNTRHRAKIYEGVPTLNAIQNTAIEAALSSPLCLLWGPPGTGKTSTVVELLCKLLQDDRWSEKRLMVAAPTHNAVDNVLRRFIRQDIVLSGQVSPVRVSTDVRKVASDLRALTCDAFVGKDLNTNHELRRKAQKRIKSCRIVFTTCIGANLGLLRNEDFELVIVDEASQQTEPMTLVPLVKGCEKLVLVGDHVQLRATTQQYSKTLDFDVSLFERLYRTPEARGIVKIMLDLQYRMHREICDFSSDQFYEGNLKTAVLDSDRPLPVSGIQWASRILFASCRTPEDLGSKSKQNRGQALLCKEICQALLAFKDAQMPSVVILTPYTRQLQLLKTMIPEVDVSSIDGFQGQEADIVVFVTVRCNQKCELGFLKDMRRLNVAATRARSGLIIIGDRTTLTKGDDDVSAAVWSRLLGKAVDYQEPSLPS